MTLENSSRRQQSRAYWMNDQTKFIGWLQIEHPSIERWEQINRTIVRSFIQRRLSGRGPNGKRLALQPITQTASFMAREFQIPNVVERLGIGNRLMRQPPLVTVPEVVSLVNWLYEREPSMARAAALMGLAGMQLQEALRLTWDKVDLENGLIEVSGEIKNEYRRRLIPIASRVQQLLENSSSKIGSVIVSPKGLSYARNDAWRCFSRRLSALMRQWNPRCAFTAKDLRNCLPTYSTIEGIHDDVWEQYIGHAPATVTSRHYVPRLASLDQAKACSKPIEIYRRRVLSRVDEAIAACGEASDFLLPEDGIGDRFSMLSAV